MTDSRERIVDFLFEAGMLARVPRSGFSYLGSGDQSVAEHALRMTQTAYVLAQLDGNVDTERLLAMCLFHDLPETRTSDHNNVTKRYNIPDESSAIADQTHNLPFGEHVAGLIEEFEAGETREAQLARDADQLEMILELKRLQDIGNPIERMVTERRRAKIADVVSRRQRGVVVFEDIADPHNAAAVLRTSEALGFQKICYIFEVNEPFDPRRVGKESSGSANKWLDFSIYHSTEACLQNLNDQGYETVATVADGDAESILDADLTNPDIALLFGNEHRGLSEKAVELSDRQLTIPLGGMVRSLNLSVAAAICLFEVTRQRDQRGPDAYRFPRAERERLLDSFVERASE